MVSPICKAGGLWALVHVLVASGLVVGLYFSVPAEDHASTLIVFQEAPQLDAATQEITLYSAIRARNGKKVAGLVYTWPSGTGDSLIRIERFEMQKSRQLRFMAFCNFSALELFNEPLEQARIDEDCVKVADSTEKVGRAGSFTLRHPHDPIVEGELRSLVIYAKPTEGPTAAANRQQTSVGSVRTRPPTVQRTRTPTSAPVAWANDTRPPGIANIWGIASFFPRSARPTLANVTLEIGIGGDARDLRATMGLKIMALSVFLAFAIFLDLVTLISMLMSRQRRKYQAIVIIVLILNIISTLLLLLQSYLADPQNVASCKVFGFSQHVFSLSAITWYVCGAFSTFFSLFSTRKYVHRSYQESAALYHIVAWAVVLVDCVIVWGLLAEDSGTLSYGPLSPWKFCWMNPTTLIYAYFVPAALAIIANLVLTVWVIAVLVQVRSRRIAKGGSTNADTVRNAIALFVSNNVGTLAYGVLGLFFIVNRNQPNNDTLIIFGAMMFIQAVALWLVFFVRRKTMLLWIATCSGRLKELNNGSTNLESFASSSNIALTRTESTTDNASSMVSMDTRDEK